MLALPQEVETLNMQSTLMSAICSLYVGSGIPPVEAPLSPLSPQRCNLSFSRIFRPLPLKLLPPLPRLLKRLTGLINRKSDVARGNGSVPLTSLLLPSSAPSLKTHATMGLCSGCYLCTPGGTRTCCTASRVLHAGIQMALIAVSQGDSKPARLASGPEFAFEAFKVTQGNLGFLAKRRTARRVPEMKA
jgi:hypothetical protein